MCHVVPPAAREAFLKSRPPGPPEKLLTNEKFFAELFTKSDPPEAI
jgi:hypothetical protein